MSRRFAFLAPLVLGIVPGSIFSRTTQEEARGDSFARLDPDLQERLADLAPQSHAGAESRLPEVSRWLSEWAGELSAGEVQGDRFAADIVGAAPTRAAFRDVRSSSQLEVQTAAPRAEDPQAWSTFEARPEARRALIELLEPLGSEPRIAFKPLQIDEDLEGRLSVRVRFEGDGRSGERLAQVRGEWLLSFDSESTALTSLEVEWWHAAQGGSEPFLTEITEAVVGREPAYRSQLAHGLEYWRQALDTQLGLPLLGHPSGLAVADVDGDGWEDVYVTQPGGLPNRLFLHRSDGRASDGSAEAGLDFLEFSRGALFLDWDGDRDRDLVVVVLDDLLFLENDGSGRFAQRAAQRVVNATSLCAADYDGDGDLDLYACAYFNPYEGGAFPVPYEDARNGGRNVLLRNDGDWRSSDVTDEVGLGAQNHGFSFAASWEDFDGDHDFDLYVANDFGRNVLYRNEGGRFTEVAAAAGVEDVAAGMGVSWGDVDNDGRWDLYVSNMFSAAGHRITAEPEFLPAAEAGLRSLLRRHARGNSMFLNQGDGTFRDRSLELGVAMGRWSWGSRLVDLDGDGWLDILAPNGFRTVRRSPDDL